ncbi:MAG: extracellular solute-binding protein [Eubacteriales bacterium]|nr:extracellular solute-binding protein [Eubacteriales bacterium]
MKKLVTLVMILCLMLTAIPSLAVDEHPPEYYEEQVQLLVDNLQSWYEENYGEGHLVEPFEEPVTVRVVNYYGATLETNMATWNDWWGETLENNRFSDAIKRALNIDVEYMWLKDGSDYDNQLRLEIMAGNLPDMFLVRNQTDLLQLAESDLIMPVEDVIEQYFTTHQKGVINSDGGMLLEMATYEGQVYGIPRNVSDTDTFSYIWLRKDWMDQLNLEAPKTMDDLKNLMIAFGNANLGGADKTYGMMIDSTLYYSTRGLFAGFDAYPEFWVTDGDQIVWGGTQDNVKEALSFLHELYNDGLIDPEFITQTNGDAQALLWNQQTGIVYGGHWLAHALQTNLYDKDNSIDWMCVALPSIDGEPVEQYLTPNKRGWIAINKEYEHPEVAGMIAALCDFSFVSGITNGTWWMSQDSAQELQPFQGSVSSWDNYNTWLNLLECYETGDESVLRGKAITYWSNLTTSSQIWAWEHMFGTGEYTPMRVLADAIDNDRIHYDAFLGAQSELMIDRWSTIKDEQLKAFTKIIIGEISVEDGFAAWLNTFDSMGGTEITAEVNAWYAESQAAKAQ